MTLRELGALMDRRDKELEWSDYQSAKICALLANINRDPKKGKVYKVTDFMSTYEHKPAEPQTPEQMIDNLHGIMGFNQSEMITIWPEAN